MAGEGSSPCPRTSPSPFFVVVFSFFFFLAPDQSFLASFFLALEPSGIGPVQRVVIALS